MLNSAVFYQLVSGQRRGLIAQFWRAMLRVASWPYSLAMRFRNWRYDRNPKLTTKVAVPVVSVGNLTLGGTGKTPCVEWICRWLRSRGIRVTILSRGYGAEESAYNDEARELEEKLPDVPHVQNPDRIAAAELAIEEFATQFLVLDDAFQHRRIARDLNLVLLDATAPDGFGAVFPRGTLREPLSGIARADGLILTRADRITSTERAALRTRMSKLAPGAFWCEAIHQSVCLRDAQGNETNLEQLTSSKVAALCAIGNPAAFEHTIRSTGAELVELRSFQDHHQFSRDDIDSLGTWAAALPVQMVLCTHKDLVKIGQPTLGGKPLLAVRIGLAFLTGEQELIAALERLVALVPAED